MDRLSPVEFERLVRDYGVSKEDIESMNMQLRGDRLSYPFRFIRRTVDSDTKLIKGDTIVCTVAIESEGQEVNGRCEEYSTATDAPESDDDEYSPAELGSIDVKIMAYKDALAKGFPFLHNIKIHVAQIKPFERRVGSKVTVWVELRDGGDTLCIAWGSHVSTDIAAGRACLRAFAWYINSWQIWNNKAKGG